MTSRAVDAETTEDPSQFIGERDLGCVERIARVLEGFRSAWVYDSKWTVEKGKEVRKRFDGPHVRRADHRVRGRVEVRDARSFAEELRAHGDAHVQS